MSEPVSILQAGAPLTTLILLILGVLFCMTIGGFFLPRSKWERRDFLSHAITFWLGIVLLFAGIFANREAGLSEEAQQALQETTSYDALQNVQTEDYQMVVLDGEGEKDVRYYSKKMRGYRYYRVKPDLSYEEVTVTETAFLPDSYKGE